ncbi:sugar phosphate isomerase/epimerase family protein [Brachybacterium sp. AOP25-B2-12]|uniref:sugar phosphate isomerase/epimerase family protein n=1 Tax=Brachybacterium sp. AOP25-B2-12 TaxID=3457710 RepID=UPI004034DA50
MSRLSLNQATCRPYDLRETAEAAARHDIGWIGLWTDPVADLGVAPTRKLLADTGLSVSSLCRVGFFADKRGGDLRTAVDGVRRAIATAHEVQALQLTVIAGGLPPWDTDIASAESRVRDALAVLVEDARAAEVRLALEPLHPLFATSRSIVTTLAQALRVVDPLPVDAVGLLVDAYAVAWDPDLQASLLHAGPRLAGYQVDDFALPLPVPENMHGRLLPGDGELDLARITGAVLAAGYTGPIEVEVFSEELWAQDLDTIVHRTVASYRRSVLPTLAPLEGIPA